MEWSRRQYGTNIGQKRGIPGEEGAEGVEGRSEFYPIDNRGVTPTIIYRPSCHEGEYKMSVYCPRICEINLFFNPGSF